MICEEKHMGSRAVVVVCRDEEAARQRFGVDGTSGAGIVYTRTGRRFFDDRASKRNCSTARRGVTAAGLWDEFETDWLCLDCELMPWSAKAQELLKQQYAAVGVAARTALGEVSTVLAAAASIEGISELPERTRLRAGAAEKYVESYRHYCWPVESIEDFRLAPFHLMASGWHRSYRPLARVAHGYPLEDHGKQDAGILLETHYRIVDTTDDTSQQKAIAWWSELTSEGGEGIVVKPLEFVAKGTRGLVQPAVKCRGGVSADHLRPGVHASREPGTTRAHAVSPASGRWHCANSLSVLSRWSDLFAASPYTACMRPSLEFWRWRASRSTRGFRVMPSRQPAPSLAPDSRPLHPLRLHPLRTSPPPAAAPPIAPTARLAATSVITLNRPA